MAWVVDTCLLIDVNENDPVFGVPSLALLKAKRPSGLCIAPVSFVELGPVFDGKLPLARTFLESLGVQWRQLWSEQDCAAAFVAWADFVRRKRLQQLRRRPVADALIGAFAQRFEGVLTRNAPDFRAILPNLKILEP